MIVHSKEPSWCILSFEPLECPAVCSLTRMVHLPPCLPFHHTCEDEEDFFVARRLASLPHSGIFFRRAILLQANCFLLVYVAISWRAQERTPASGPNRSPVRQRSNALKRLPTSLTNCVPSLVLHRSSDRRPDEHCHHYRDLCRCSHIYGASFSIMWLESMEYAHQMVVPVVQVVRIMSNSTRSQGEVKGQRT